MSWKGQLWKASWKNMNLRKGLKVAFSNIVKKQTYETHRILFYLFNKNWLSDYYVPNATMALRIETGVEVRNYRPIQYSFYVLESLDSVFKCWLHYFFTCVALEKFYYHFKLRFSSSLNLKHKGSLAVLFWRVNEEIYLCCQTVPGI